MKEKELLLKFEKRVDNQHRIVMPYQVLKKFGRDFYMEMYENEVRLIPIRKEKNNEKL